MKTIKAFAAIVLLLAMAVVAIGVEVQWFNKDNRNMLGYNTIANTWVPWEMDGTTNAGKCILYEHAEIHSSNNYEYVSYVDLTVDFVRDIQITTPDTAKWSHLTFSFTTEKETNWFLYEDVVIAVAGTSVTPWNSNRNSSNASGLTMAYIDNNTLVLANDDTTVAAAKLLMDGKVGEKKESGSADHSHEIILKQGEDYTLRFEAAVAGYVSYHISEYEHTNR